MMFSKRESSALHDAVKRIIASSPEGGDRLMSAAIMVEILIHDENINPDLAKGLMSQIRKGATLHDEWHAAFASHRFLQKEGRAGENWYPGKNNKKDVCKSTSPSEKTVLHDAVRRIIAASPEGGRRLMSAPIMIDLLIHDEGFPSILANRLFSQIRKGAGLHEDWKAAFQTSRFLQRQGRAGANWAPSTTAAQGSLTDGSKKKRGATVVPLPPWGLKKAKPEEEPPSGMLPSLVTMGDKILPVPTAAKGAAPFHGSTLDEFWVSNFEPLVEFDSLDGSATAGGLAMVPSLPTSTALPFKKNWALTLGGEGGSGGGLKFLSHLRTDIIWSNPASEQHQCGSGSHFLPSQQPHEKHRPPSACVNDSTFMHRFYWIGNGVFTDHRAL